MVAKNPTAFLRPVAILLAALCWPCGSVTAALTISSTQTQNVSCSGGVCSPTAKNAVLNVTDLENLLATGNVDVTTTGAGAQANDLIVKGALGWSNSSTLSLDARKSVTVDDPISIAGSGNLTLTADDGGTNGTFSIGDKGSIAFANLSSSLVINGTDYVLAPDVKTLASEIAANPAGAFALANSYDASVDGSYPACPIPTEFTGSFQGLGNTISNLSIVGPSTIGHDLYEGLFAWADVGAVLSGVRLKSVTLTTSKRHVMAGAVAGELHGATMTWTFASGIVTLQRKSTGAGLVGINDGTVEESHSSVEIKGDNQIDVGGGVVGINLGYVRQSFAVGSVSSTYSGGLIGQNEGEVDDSYATGSVNGPVAGGLVGNNLDGVIDSSYATGQVTVASWRYIPQAAGGLVGMNSASIQNSYSNGSVVGIANSDVGGLVGQNNDAISYSYSTGAVSSGTGSLFGGLIGDDQSTSGSLDDTYWDLDTSGVSNPDQGAGNVTDDPGITGLTTEQFQSGLPTGFDPAIWREASTINNGLPYVIANPPRKQK